MDKARSVKKRLLVGGAKLVALVAFFFVLENQIINLETRSVAASAGQVAHAEAGVNELVKLRNGLAESLEALEASRDDFRTFAASLDAERGEALRLLENRVRRLQRSVVDRFDDGKHRLERAQTRAVENTQRLARLTDSVDRLSQRDQKKMQQMMIHPTAQLRGNGTVGSGVLLYSEKQPRSGVGGDVVYTTFVLTAHHVVLEVTGNPKFPSEVKEVNLLIDPENDEVETFEARLVLEDRYRDLALLRLNTSKSVKSLVEFMALSDLDTLDVFSPAYAVGCPLGNRPMPTLGEISSCGKDVGSQTFWMLNAPTFFGNSGGGVYFAGNYQLIGISSMIYTYGKKSPSVVPHMGLFVPLRNVYEWLDEEGYSFVYRRKPVPDALAEALVYHSGSQPPASLRSASMRGFPSLKDGPKD